MKKSILLSFSLVFISLPVLFAQDSEVLDSEAIIALIDNYSKARELQDTVLLKEILMPNIDQLVSSGEWRMGLQAAIEGMQRSSNTNQGKRTLKVDRIKFLSKEVAVADARYVIESENGNIRKMWSTFLLVLTDQGWKISGIRNMLPAGQ
ncbi:hypothetical protein SAMN00777080_2427 [Aquiflexum balticum DSM 16537]|uniref:DUF4440 domain-containing protein n=1 Tax=Aquiflexum balticum DSM 16537 TaxID=758820 RepID=A0A1W2H4E2_9BACT|nr:DUF4440 domain-containing protein [Aquiflexum balticum]SMD43817.1 hypothetical protein SAMN00777080_2427 [Aquiflexum balticum DSM 16537]